MARTHGPSFFYGLLEFCHPHVDVFNFDAFECIIKDALGRTEPDSRGYTRVGHKLQDGDASSTSGLLQARTSLLDLLSLKPAQQSRGSNNQCCQLHSLPKLTANLETILNLFNPKDYA
jgi:hypothetical protein